MRSFRTELENNVIQRDIIELEKKIFQFKNGKIDEEGFRSLRLARGVYGQRQLGVQMIRIKIPFGKLNARKLLRICDVSEEYSKGRLHITTRQDIQIHYVSLDRTPELWAELEKDQITLREACGNTVRNITASATSGICKEEPFDPRPYADALFRYFLRNPICQEMGRKFKISFSNTDEDTAFSFMHDMGFVAKTKEVNGEITHGFQTWIAGGLGSQSIHAHLLSDFLPADEIIPMTEAVLRIFERYGERAKRMKARLKFLVKKMGFEEFKRIVLEELEGMNKKYPITYTVEPVTLPSYEELIPEEKSDAYDLWKSQNVIEQNNGLFAIGIKVRLGDIYIDQARKLAALMQQYSGDEITLSVEQNILVRHIEAKALYTWYAALKEIGLSQIGYLKASDITSCPGTDTCNLGIASSTGLSLVLEKIIDKEYANKLDDSEISIKISGCMNSCGQHMIASIGFQGMSIKTKDKRILPAAQILLGGANVGGGQGIFADKVIKLPSKRATDALRIILDDYLAHKSEGQLFYKYYQEKSKSHFYELLKPLADTTDVDNTAFIDWGSERPYVKAIGIGECAGVVVDLVSTLFYDTEEKIEKASRALEEGQYQDSVYHTYTSIINTAKALLISEEHKTNSHISITSNFQEHFVDTSKIELQKSFHEVAYEFKNKEADATYAEVYLEKAIAFYKQADVYRKKQLAI